MADANPNAVAEIVARYAGDASMVIPMMQDLQAEIGYLPPDELKSLSRALALPVSRLYGIATFYASFRLVPKGEHTITLCLGTACYLKGANHVSEAIQREFGLVPGSTSPDGKFTFAPVNCLGACALAPVMVVDGEYHGGLTPDSAVKVLKKIAAAPAPGGAGAAAKSSKEKKAGPAAAPPPPPRKGKKK